MSCSERTLPKSPLALKAVRWTVVLLLLVGIALVGVIAGTFLLVLLVVSALAGVLVSKVL